MPNIEPIILFIIITFINSLIHSSGKSAKLPPISSVQCMVEVKPSVFFPTKSSHDHPIWNDVSLLTLKTKDDVKKEVVVC